MADTASVLHYFSDSSLERGSYYCHPLSPPVTTFHLPTWQEWLLEERTLKKAELHIGSRKQERICLAKWPGPQSCKCHGAQREILQMCPTAQKGVSCRLLQWQWKTQIWPNNAVKAFGVMDRGLEKACFWRESREKGTQQRNEGEQSRTLFQKTDFDTRCCWGRRTVPALYTQDVPFQDPVCSHWQLFFAANSRLQQNYYLCFLAAKAGPGVYSNRYWCYTYSQFYSQTAETGGSQ